MTRRLWWLLHQMDGRRVLPGAPVGYTAPGRGAGGAALAGRRLRSRTGICATDGLRAGRVGIAALCTGDTTRQGMSPERTLELWHVRCMALPAGRPARGGRLDPVQPGRANEYFCLHDSTPVFTRRDGTPHVIGYRRGEEVAEVWRLRDQARSQPLGSEAHDTAHRERLAAELAYRNAVEVSGLWRQTRAPRAMPSAEPGPPRTCCPSPRSAAASPTTWNATGRDTGPGHLHPGLERPGLRHPHRVRAAERRNHRHGEPLPWVSV